MTGATVGSTRVRRPLRQARPSRSPPRPDMPPQLAPIPACCWPTCPDRPGPARPISDSPPQPSAAPTRPSPRRLPEPAPPIPAPPDPTCRSTPPAALPRLPYPPPRVPAPTAHPSPDHSLPDYPHLPPPSPCPTNPPTPPHIIPDYPRLVVPPLVRRTRLPYPGRPCPAPPLDFPTRPTPSRPDPPPTVQRIDGGLDQEIGLSSATRRAAFPQLPCSTRKIEMKRRTERGRGPLPSFPQRHALGPPRTPRADARRPGTTKVN